ncbi:hypothetical protein [Streptomyces sp. GQFP]|uniref:hypothetical protein n=1 Tax=Streptomyces sp. GQFP TaxID=2907545 RepID=UPI001F3E8350|nr:hypothetical protein [Streptomyces sp. GQFP]UIX31958.1 hypothetical protein LUX31_19015 [Streptomyces sp. GQFP]
MYDALVSADIVTARPDEEARVLIDLFGLPEPRPQAYLEPEGHGFRAVWLRIRPSLKHAPTRIELIGHRPRAEAHDYVEERVLAQGDRPVRTHATVLAGDVEAVLDRLRRGRVRHRVTPPSEDFDFPRVWVGVTDDDPFGYDPGTDAGLWTEVVPTAHSGVPVRPAEEEAPAGLLDRVVARRFLVVDAEASARTLESNLGLVATSVTRGRDSVVATYEMAMSRSASLELVQPLDADSDLGRYAGQWGPGPHAIVLGSGDLAGVEADLASRGAGVARVSRGPGDERLLVAAKATGGVPFEVVAVSGRTGPGRSS